MISRRPRFWFKMITALLLVVAIASPVSAGNDFITVDLRTDQWTVANAAAYQVLIYASAATQPAGANDFTSAWLSVDLGNQPGPGGAKFSQVGLMTRPGGLRWFVFAESGVTCYRGSSTYGGRGCEGLPGDLVSVANWYRVELRRVSGGWHAMLYDTNSFPWVLAQISDTGATIYDATVTSEQGYSGATDPYTQMDYFYSHPLHYVPATGAYVDWPNSANGIIPSQNSPRFSQLYSVDLNGLNTFCPTHYGATLNYWNDERVWFAGTSGQTCGALMFPPKTYIPLVIKN